MVEYQKERILRTLTDQATDRGEEWRGNNNARIGYKIKLYDDEIKTLKELLAPKV